MISSRDLVLEDFLWEAELLVFSLTLPLPFISAAVGILSTFSNLNPVPLLGVDEADDAGLEVRV